MAAPRLVLEREPLHAFEFVVPEQSRPGFFAQRVVESLIAIVALVITSPIMAAIAVIIRAGTRGTALFWQVRVGKNEELFRFVKYRELYRYKYTDDQLRKLKFKAEDDPRVTPQGEWLRKSTLDELPNFWNVLRGDMALVGPRPEIPEMLPYYEGEMQLKFKVRPGITGLAQISGRGRLGFYETVEFDVEYVKKRSFKLDLKILLLTMYKIATRDGAF